MKKILTLASIAIVMSFAVQSFASTTSAPSLDGKTFTGKIGSTAPKSDKFDDDLKFEKGTFVSTACQDQGFSATTYSTSKNGKAVTFEATSKNDKGEQMVWTGTVKGKSVKASIVKTTADGKTEEWAYNGSAKK